MAVVPRPRHASARITRDLVVLPASATETPPSVFASTVTRERLANLFPLAGSLAVVAAIFVMPLHPLTAGLYALGVTAFFVYWVLRSYGIVLACMIGERRITRWLHTDWRARYAQFEASHVTTEAWEWPRHLVVIPNYKEAESELRRTIDSLAAQSNREQIVVVLAMEAREDGSEGKAARLLLAYRDVFADMFATYHPAGLEGEAAGKGSNEAWALRDAHRRLVASGLEDIERFTVTSCDADAYFMPHHFAVLNYLFLSGSDRYRTFWQPAIVNSNNIWDVPAGPRMVDGLSGINRLANLTIPLSVKFPTSCYSLSWQMLHAIDYWDEEVIPEDWHLYLKASYTLGDRVHVQPMFVRLGNDCVLTDSVVKTTTAHYFQTVRHAWGASDIPYAWRATWRAEGPLSLPRRILLAASVTKVHTLWVAQWFMLTLGVAVPVNMARHLGAPMPHWFTDERYTMLGLNLHIMALLDPTHWFVGDSPIVETAAHMNLPGLLISVCSFPLLALIVAEFRQRGPRPAHVSRWTAVRSIAVWPLLMPLSLYFAAMPALHAQLRLASGIGLVYRVAEKGTKGDLSAAGTPAVPTAFDYVLPFAALTAALPGSGLRLRREATAATPEASVTVGTAFVA